MISPVLENIIDQPHKHRSCERIIQIHGVPCDTVTAFLSFLYCSRCTDEQMEKYGIQSARIVAHVFGATNEAEVHQVACRTINDQECGGLLQLARLCHSPDLYIKCMKLLTNHFKYVEATEGWKFLQKYDPWLELKILQFMDEDESINSRFPLVQLNLHELIKIYFFFFGNSKIKMIHTMGMEQRKKKSRKRKEEQRLYAELIEAMKCLEHICTEKCTDVGPYNVELRKERRSCIKYSM
ncbi:hypothetical protein K1719_016945 [Acacia pycnantha]|nr:hypothetical protein K1719_016945 [Acacia pycnantha]